MVVGISWVIHKLKDILCEVFVLLFQSKWFESSSTERASVHKVGKKHKVLTEQNIEAFDSLFRRGGVRTSLSTKNASLFCLFFSDGKS